MNIKEPLCLICEYAEGFPWGYCKAFNPIPIPEDILNGNVGHKDSWPKSKQYPYGDNGLQFKPLSEGDVEAKSELQKEAHFEEVLHPRDERGRFIDSLGRSLPDHPGPRPPKSDIEARAKWHNDMIHYNNVAGRIREDRAAHILLDRYPRDKGFIVHRQMTLCDNLGRTLLDSKGKARCLDFVVEKDGKAYRSFEVTSKEASKTAQSGKEKDIVGKHREAGNKLYGKLKGGDVLLIPYSVKTTRMSISL